ncbi:MAG: carotenoid oxygenase family protein, partial [Candidatus Eremiobacteraeota bacterium]|nr:carotenoid oxygenase family protein [Candidatus Eremiobacteraeota bacterium]
TYDFAGRVTTAVSAHPKIDPKTGDMHFFGYSLFAPPYVTYYVANKAGIVTRVMPLEFPHATIVHDAQITDRSIIFAATPLTFDMQRAMTGQSPMVWKPELGTTFVIVDRIDTNKKPLWVKAEPFYFWHYANGFEEAGQIQLDLVRNDLAFTTGNAPSLHRVTIDTNMRTAKVRQTNDRSSEFPRINPDQTGQPYRMAYVPIADGNAPAHGFTALLQFDSTTEQTKVHTFGRGRSPGEACVVAKANGRSPEDAWIMTFVYDAATNRSDFVILDGSAFDQEPVASVHLPVRVPFGLHGNWVPGAF